MTHTEPPEIEVKPARRSLRERASIVWLVPLAAVVIALGVAAQSWLSRGPVVQILFDQASGISPGETEVRYRDVVVGRVESMGFADNLNKVVVTARVTQEIADYVDEDAAFWVVRPEVTTRGVSGLDTVLSGVFIEAVWDREPGGFVTMHEGSNQEPLLRPGQEGLTVLLRSRPGSTMTRGTAILHKGIEVGRVGTPELMPDGSTSVAPAVIYSPYDRYVYDTTRFWDTSGFSFSIGPSGAELDFNSVSSLIAGGIAFDTMVSGGMPMSKPDQIFDVFASQNEARDNLFEARTGPGTMFGMIFSENVSGLEPGAPVELRGLRIGEVTGVNGIVDPERFGDERVRLLVNMELYPGDMGIEAVEPDDVVEYFADQIQNGLRGRLATASLLTGGLKIELVERPNAPAATLELDEAPYPVIPTTESDITDAGATAQGVLQRVNDLPIEQLMQSAIDFLNSSTELVRGEELRAIPGDVRGLLGDVRGVVGSEAVQALPGQASALMVELSGAVADVREVVAQLEEAQAAERLISAVEAVGEAAETVTGSVEGVPALIESLRETADTARDLPLRELVEQATSVIEAAENLLSQPGTQDLPERLNGTLNELQLALADLREGGAVENLNQTLASAEAAAAAIQEAAGQLPSITSRLDGVLGQATSTLKGYESNSELNRSIRSALAEIQSAARAVESLARALERRPNSLLLGR